MMAASETVELIKEVMQEVCELARADSHPLSENIIEKNIADTAKMKPYKPSMLLDYEARRPLETEAISGNAIAIAEKLKVPVPRIRQLYALLKTADFANRRNSNL